MYHFDGTTGGGLSDEPSASFINSFTFFSKSSILEPTSSSENISQEKINQKYYKSIQQLGSKCDLYLGHSTKLIS